MSRILIFGYNLKLMKAKLIFLLLPLIFLTQRIVAQQSEVVGSKDVSVYENRSYYATEEVRLLPGFSFAATSGDDFFARITTHENQPVNANQNFVRTEKLLVSGVTSELQIASLAAGSKAVSYQYVDGLGRMSQIVDAGTSPESRDLVQFSSYDADGRQTKQYLPYTADQTIAGKFNENVISAQSDFYTSPPIGVASGFKPFKENVYELSVLNKLQQTITPRDDPWNATARSRRTEISYNEGGFVGITRWDDCISGPPVKNGTYPDRTLIITETTDEAAHRVTTYENSRGRVVMKSQGSGSTALQTHYIYSPNGLLMYTILPEGVSRLSTEYDASGADKQSFLDRWAFQYVYDNQQRLIAKSVPAGGWTYFVYDQWNRIVLTQDAEQRKRNEFIFAKYDAFNRPIMSGLYVSNSSIETIRSTVASSSGRFESPVNSAIGYTLSNSFPSTVSQNDLVSVNYYDNYDFLSYSGWDAENQSYAFQNLATYPQSNEALMSVKGKITGTKTRVIGQSLWLNSVTYFSKKYLPIQTITESHLGGVVRVTSKYNFVGNVEKEQLYNSKSLLTIQKRYTYDNAGRLTRMYDQVNTQPEVLMTENVYNELGQLIDHKMHSTDGGATFLQSVDRRYNIKGWLTGINNASLSIGTTNDDSNDLFGIDLTYYQEEIAVNGTNNDRLYNGQISAIRWGTNRLITPAKENIYKYEYDDFGRLRNSNSAVKDAGTFSALPDAWKESISYDNASNIKTLERNGVLNNTDIVPIDQLSYSYLSNGTESNRVAAVTDLSDSPFGFKSATANLENEYNYDGNGNLAFDFNKEISSITYNHLNLPVKIEFTRANGQIDKIEYLYDANGGRLRRTVTVNNAQVWQTDFVGTAQYDNGILSSVQNTEGRLVYRNGSFEYEYYLKDHLGNIRVVYGNVNETHSYKATMEPSMAATEETDFENVDATRPSYATVNYTKRSENLSAPDRSSECNTFTGKPIGPAKMLSVSAGDKVYMEAFARYDQVTNSTNVITANALITAVTGTFGIPSGPEGGSLYESFNSNLPVVSSSVSSNALIPKAYLAWLFFDENDLHVASGAQAITSTAYQAFEKLHKSFTADRNGSLYIFVANESDVTALTNVYFDEVYVVHEEGNKTLQVLQSTDYYPYGLSFNNYSLDRLQTDANGEFSPQLRNRYLFEGLELQKDLDVQLYQTPARMYDPALGQWASVDPLADKFHSTSPFNFNFSNPISFADPTGAAPAAAYNLTWPIAYAAQRINAHFERQAVIGQQYASGAQQIQEHLNAPMMQQFHENWNSFTGPLKAPTLSYGERMANGEFGWELQAASFVGSFLPTTAAARGLMDAREGNYGSAALNLGSAFAEFGALYKSLKTASMLEQINVRLNSHLQFAIENHTLSARQLYAAHGDPSALRKYTGTAIDMLFKRQVNADEFLQAYGVKTTPLFKYGPDVYSTPKGTYWFDITTPGQWNAHNKYINDFGVGFHLNYNFFPNTATPYYVVPTFSTFTGN